jgi:hypothetical protein
MYSYQDKQRYVSCFFGGPYEDTALAHCRPHGNCVLVATNGDAYVGNRILEVKSGQGIMYYANGDTYTGNWENDQPEGHGKMEYGKTGNTYVGGWQAGRKHGEGITKWKVSDEDLNLCRICFEAEMDAAFIRCGHMTACEECARQVKDCPVCRRPIDAVLKIWKA